MSPKAEKSTKSSQKASSTSNSIERTSDSEKETIEVGKVVGSILGPGSVVAVIGPLGSGKTRLIKGIALGLDIKNVSQVVSPTYTLINEYDGRVPLYHIDAYRLKSAGELADLGIEEYFASEGATVIEWADKVVSILPDKHLRITMSHISVRKRRIVIESLNLPFNFIKQLHSLIA